MLFQPFDPKSSVDIYFTNMPHWRQEGCTWFVTYRLADSIPKQVLERWEVEKSEWFAARGASVSEKESLKDAFLKLSKTERFAFTKCFNRKRNSYLDEGRGSCVLRSAQCSKIVLEGWDYFDGKRYILGDLIVMPNHVHLLLTPLPGFKLETILQSRKRQSSREINTQMDQTGSLWQKHSFDHIVRNEKALQKLRVYIKDNPKKARLASNEFRYRSFDW